MGRPTVRAVFAIWLPVACWAVLLWSVAGGHVELAAAMAILGGASRIGAGRAWPQPAATNDADPISPDWAKQGRMSRTLGCIAAILLSVAAVCVAFWWVFRNAHFG